MPEFLTRDQVDELRQSHRKMRDKKVADRIKAIIALNSGWSYKDVAEILLLDEVTMRRYVHQFQQDGIDGLLECRYKGGVGKLTLEQEVAVKNYFTLFTPQTTAEVVTYIKRQYGKEYTVTGVTKLMHRIGFSYKKPKRIGGKMSLEKQEAFKKQYEQIKKNLRPKDKIYFVDASHPTHNTEISYGWILKGKKNDKYIKTTSGRKRLNLNGAVELESKEAIILEEKTINAVAMVNLLVTIAQKQPHGKVYVIWDNAKHHHSRLVKNWLLHHKRFTVIFLPPYSANLNIIERLWLFFHKKITYNRYFESFEEFKKTSLTFFKNLKNYKRELNTLLTDNFQSLPA
jgi:transposase